jgi:protein-S-isoprenylcysteine O-methyltransferase Ste14
MALGGVALAAGLLGRRWPGPVRVPFVVAGVVLVVGGFAMLIVGSAHLGPALTPYPAPLPGASLRQDGLYRVVRHPIYGGALLIAFGWSLATSPYALIVAFATAVFFELKSRHEERRLIGRYPGYSEYRRRVRWKFVPGIR